MTPDLPDTYRSDAVGGLDRRNDEPPGVMAMAGSLLSGFVHLTVWIALATITISLLLLEGLWQWLASRRK